MNLSRNISPHSDACVKVRFRSLDPGVKLIIWPLGFPGYRHIPLHDSQLSYFLFSTLFIHTEIVNIGNKT